MMGRGRIWPLEENIKNVIFGEKNESGKGENCIFLGYKLEQFSSPLPTHRQKTNLVGGGGGGDRSAQYLL